MIEGNLVDVRRKEIFPARVEHRDGLITRVERVTAEYDTYIVPGLIDSHIHIELSHLCPSRFGEVVVPVLFMMLVFAVYVRRSTKRGELDD